MSWCFFANPLAPNGSIHEGDLVVSAASGVHLRAVLGNSADAGGHEVCTADLVVRVANASAEPTTITVSARTGAGSDLIEVVPAGVTRWFGPFGSRFERFEDLGEVIGATTTLRLDVQPADSVTVTAFLLP